MDRSSSRTTHNTINISGGRQQHNVIANEIHGPAVVSTTEQARTALAELDARHNEILEAVPQEARGAVAAGLGRVRQELERPKPEPGAIHRSWKWLMTALGDTTQAAQSVQHVAEAINAITG